MTRTFINGLVKILVLGACLPVLACSRSPEKSAPAGRILRQSYDLKPASRVGDIAYYRITTAYLDMDDHGKVRHEAVVDGYFTKAVLEFEKDQRAESFVWRVVKKGEREVGGDVMEFAVLPYSKDFRYAFADWTRDRFPVDLSSIPKSMDGWKFVVNLIDAHTFDVLADLNNYRGRLERIGDTALLPASAIPVSMDFPPLFTDTYFVNADLTVVFQGLTLCQEEPCAVLAFESDENGLHMVTNMNGLAFPTEGTSYYWGEIFLSLENKRIVRGKIMERVDMVTSLGSLGEPAKHVTRREIVLERIRPGDFERIPQ